MNAGVGQYQSFDTCKPFLHYTLQYKVLLLCVCVCVCVGGVRVVQEHIQLIKNTLN